MSFQERIDKARLNQGKSNKADAANNNEQEEQFDSDYFGIENLRNSLACIDLRLADGSRKAVPYSYIMEINFEPSGEIEIITPTRLIKIEGRDMERLYDYLSAYRVRYIQVHIGTDAVEEGVFVKNITLQEN